MSTKKCKDCNEVKTATYSHIAKSGAKVYRDEKGRLWKSNQCPPCQAKQRAEVRARQAAQPKQEDVEDSKYITIMVPESE